MLKDQKSILVEEMTKSIAEIRKKDGLEKAIKDFMKNPSMGVPVDMRSGLNFFCCCQNFPESIIPKNILIFLTYPYLT
jgi:hypothetical protein